jgi:hypothetical protein
MAASAMHVHPIDKAAGNFALRPPGKNLNAYELTSPGAPLEEKNCGGSVTEMRTRHLTVRLPPITVTRRAMAHRQSARSS